LAEHDNEKTGEQCRTKVKKLRQEYKKIKDNHNLTSRGRIQWKYLEKLDKILGTQPATRPQVSLETLDSQLQNDPSGNETDIVEQEDGYNNTSVDSTLDNLDSSEASGSGTPTVIRSRTPSQDIVGWVAKNLMTVIKEVAVVSKERSTRGVRGKYWKT